MSNLILKYLNLPWTERILLIKTFTLLGAVRLVIIMVPFRHIAAYLGKHMEESPETQVWDRDFAREIGWAIERVSSYTPWESKCLVQAIVGKLLLRQRKLHNTLYLGVAKNKNNKMIAHAWLRCGTDVVTGACGGIEDFTVVAKFADLREETNCFECDMWDF